MDGKLRILVSALALGCLMTSSVASAGSSSASSSSLVPGCSGQAYVQPFLPWLDPASYVLMPAGAVERADGWTLSGGAKIVSGNETWRVNSPIDSRSLLLPSGSSATTPSLCITLFHPTLRLFAMNAGPVTTTLKVEAITDVLGSKLVTPIALLAAGSSWNPTIPAAFLDNLAAATGGSVAFRFTPVGSRSGWRIDDVYVDPFKER